jgi:prophage regulatory protein
MNMATVSSITPIKTLLNPVIEQALSNTLPINQLLRRPVVEAATGWTRSTIYRAIDKGLFTLPISLGGGRVAWPQTEVQALNQARIAGKSDAEIKSLVIELEALRSGSNPETYQRPPKVAARINGQQNTRGAF